MAARPPSGRKIWDAVREELLLNLYPLPFSTLAPSVYHVYLHPDDFATIEGIAPKLAEQLQQALTGEVERINRGRARPVRALVSRLLDRDPLPAIEVPPDGWEVHIRPDPNGELTRGQLGIECTLALPAPVEYEGTPTTRIIRSVVGARGRSSTMREVPTPVAAPAPQQAGAGVASGRSAGADGSSAVGAGGPAAASAVGSAPAAASSAASVGAPAAIPAPPPSRGTESRSLRDRARLAYTDDQGAHEFIMRKDTVSIGRGGSAVWVDVQVATGSRVSREHVRLRAAADGRFYVQDVSLWGTTVDDEPIPVAVKGPEGVVEPGAEHALPARARIGLADALTIDFEAL